MGASPNFEKRELASIQQQPNYLQSVYMMQNLQLFIGFSHIRTLMKIHKTHPVAQSVDVVLTFFYAIGFISTQ